MGMMVHVPVAIHLTSLNHASGIATTTPTIVAMRPTSIPRGAVLREENPICTKNTLIPPLAILIYEH